MGEEGPWFWGANAVRGTAEQEFFHDLWRFPRTTVVPLPFSHAAFVSLLQLAGMRGVSFAVVVIYLSSACADRAKLNIVFPRWQEKRVK